MCRGSGRFPTFDEDVVVHRHICGKISMKIRSFFVEKYEQTCLAIFVLLYVCIHVCRIISYWGLVVFILRITASAIYLALWLLFTLCKLMSVLHCSVNFNKLNDDDDDENCCKVPIISQCWRILQKVLAPHPEVDEYQNLAIFSRTGARLPVFEVLRRLFLNCDV